MITQDTHTDIYNCIAEINDTIELTTEQVCIIREILIDTFGVKLSEHSCYVDSHSLESEDEIDW